MVRTPEPVFPTVGNFFKMIGVSEMCKAPTVVFNASCDSGCEKHYQEVGLNVTFPLIFMINGYEVESRTYPWMPVDTMIFETLFLENQLSLLENVSSWYPRVDLVSVQYSCVFHPFNCTVMYTILNASVVTVLNVTGQLARGTDLDSLKFGAHILSNRWTKICEKVRSLDTVEDILAAFVVLSGTGKMICFMLTHTPVKYTLTLYGDNLNTISVNATLRVNRTVTALIVNQTTPDYDFTRVNCSISSPFGWKVEIERRIYEDVRDGLITLGFDPMGGYYGAATTVDGKETGSGASETRTHIIVPALLIAFFVSLGVLLCFCLRRSDVVANRFRRIPTTEL